MNAAGAPKATVKTMLKRLTTPASQRASTDRLELLRQAIGRSETSQQQTAELWSLIRGFSVAEVKTALESLPKDIHERINYEIASMLYNRWAQLDPEEAASSAMKEENYYLQHTIINSVLTAWSQTDPESAIRWGRDCGSETANHLIMMIAAKQWVEHDPTTAISRALAEFPKAIPSIISILPNKLSATSEARLKMFEILAEHAPEDIPWTQLAGFAQRLSGLSSSTVDEIMAEMTEANCSDALVQKYKSAFDYYVGRYKQPEPQDPAEMVESATTDQARTSAYQMWAVRSPEEAIRWAESRADSEVISKTVGLVTEELLQSAWSPSNGTYPQESKSLLTQFAAWQRIDEQTASAWLETMPSDIQKFVTSSPDPPQ